MAQQLRGAGVVSLRDDDSSERESSSMSTSGSRSPRLTIGLPVYNGERYLPQTLSCLLAQTFGDFELIVCDNASGDSTKEICLDFASLVAPSLRT